VCVGVAVNKFLDIACVTCTKYNNDEKNIINNNVVYLLPEEYYSEDKVSLSQETVAIDDCAKISWNEEIPYSQDLVSFLSAKYFLNFIE
jgi:hypothetical protein